MTDFLKNAHYRQNQRNEGGAERVLGQEAANAAGQALREMAAQYQRENPTGNQLPFLHAAKLAGQPIEKGDTDHE